MAMNQKFVQDTEQENSWWPDNIGIPGSEEHVHAVCEGIRSYSIQTYGMKQGTLAKEGF